MNIDTIELTISEKVVCEGLLPSWHKLITLLKDEEVFNIKSIPLLVKYEMSNKMRKNVIDRLLARYYKLKRKHMYNKLCRVIDFRGRNDT